MKRQTRVLALFDAPTSCTGFATVSKNIFQNLAKDKELNLAVDIVGINHFGDVYDFNEHPYLIYPALRAGYPQDPYGRARFINALIGKDPAIKGFPYDIVFTLQDPFIMESVVEKIKEARLAYQQATDQNNRPHPLAFRWIAYYPADGDYKENWADTVLEADYPVMYTNFGKSRIAYHDLEGKKGSDKVRVIYHGTNTKDFFPVGDKEKEKFRADFFKGMVKPNTFLVTNINRNQYRKEVERSMRVFKEFKKVRPDSILYLHMKEQDAGGSIHEMARRLKMVEKEDYIIPKYFDTQVGYPIKILNLIYNTSDLIITTTLGEGFGLSLTEGMTTKTPVLAPNHTSIPELFNSGAEIWQRTQDAFAAAKELNTDELQDIEKNYKELRGIPVKAGSTLSEWFCGGEQDTENIRPLTNVEDMVKKMIWAYDNPDKCKQITENAYKWVIKLKWSTIAEQWKAIFKEAIKDLEVFYATRDTAEVKTEFVHAKTVSK